MFSPLGSHATNLEHHVKSADQETYEEVIASKNKSLKPKIDKNQICKNSVINLRNLRLVEIKDSHTGVHLKNVIFDICKKFGIGKSQIYTVTIDNGTNMVKAVDLMSKELEEIENKDETEEENDGETN